MFMPELFIFAALMVVPVVFLVRLFQREYGARYKRCPYCASRIRSEAIVCSHCQRVLSEAEYDQ